ncbi:hypothetical protein XCR_4321 [Xanthomonas campestris pv. raphani 756C]|nr:hypothetical protein XCR_4321 [Xanthomonas campestris pv. raphani 756C]
MQSVTQRYVHANDVTLACRFRTKTPQILHCAVASEHIADTRALGA